MNRKSSAYGGPIRHIYVSTASVHFAVCVHCRLLTNAFPAVWMFITTHTLRLPCLLFMSSSTVVIIIHVESQNTA
jgi:hypothetical protein